MSRAITAITATVLLVFTIVTLQPPVAISETTDTLQPGFTKAILQLSNAQSVGATPSELSEPVALLNRALELNREALKPNTTDAERAGLLTQVDEILTNVENQATQLTATSSQRKSKTEFLTYLSGMMAAILGTIFYASAMSLRRKYRIKRTFKMRVSRK